jgi:hypothetical protein
MPTPGKQITVWIAGNADGDSELSPSLTTYQGPLMLSQRIVAIARGRGVLRTQHLQNASRLL